MFRPQLESVFFLDVLSSCLESPYSFFLNNGLQSIFNRPWSSLKRKRNILALIISDFFFLTLAFGENSHQENTCNQFHLIDLFFWYRIPSRHLWRPPQNPGNSPRSTEPTVHLWKFVHLGKEIHPNKRKETCFHAKMEDVWILQNRTCCHVHIYWRIFGGELLVLGWVGSPKKRLSTFSGWNISRNLVLL